MININFTIYIYRNIKNNGGYHMTDDMKGKVTIVTGGGKGIGFGIATAFAKAKSNIVITGRTESTLISAKEKLEKYGVEVLPITADGGYEEQVKEAVDKIIEKFGRIDVLINNAQDLVFNLLNIHKKTLI